MTRQVNLCIITAAIICSFALTTGKYVPPQKEPQTFHFKSGAAQLIYGENANSVSLTVMNPQLYPMLVQPEVAAEDKKIKAPFIVTPPLFRLDGLQQRRIKGIAIRNHDSDTNEHLFWLCLTGMLPEPESGRTDAGYKKRQRGHGAPFLTQLHLKHCLKLFIRTSRLRHTPDDVASNLPLEKTVNSSGEFPVAGKGLIPAISVSTTASTAACP
ncbi:fimbria/pilus periplasmic chaperone [Pantoea piersonii]|jgi:P pilus assembly chaperone PapD|uniref:fimbria/pilus periplasmic chaperone n=1 Tax=Pantoea piersonii TaxID=2364647 RepID=UPI000EA1EF3A|nr:fimbria/pilus periplasmic chaperone [Pantoea piersonii]MBZ6387486.1 fimbria/pilus periplasmic chaperone [Pantoea piersonii]MBZ6400754.1 fimbria/pilus periplasmic chaperone [Pantoea piersonii]MBZ6408910.1 fimbria/pilus periplasmic chaperone [Pantoea piersonii]MBZ6427093.1 fimbria/pilus periplasmic chaperone [Pantoea piersonii]NYB04352.1 fimbria/pilus periplasmic chaperone [Pantoea piersonii]